MTTQPLPHSISEKHNGRALAIAKVRRALAAPGASDVGARVPGGPGGCRSIAKRRQGLSPLKLCRALNVPPRQDRIILAGWQRSIMAFL